MNAKNEASEAYFKAYDAVHPNTVVDVLWIESKAGYTKEVVPSMNLNKATRICEKLQDFMANVSWRMSVYYEGSHI